MFPTIHVPRGMAGKKPGRQADPSEVAADIVRGIACGRSVVYTPCIWRWIMTIVRSFPKALFVCLKL